MFGGRALLQLGSGIGGEMCKLLAAVIAAPVGLVVAGLILARWHEPDADTSGTASTDVRWPYRLARWHEPDVLSG